MGSPVFVLSTGRCGSSWLRRFLDRSERVEAFHMYRGRTAEYSNDCHFILEQNYAYYAILNTDAGRRERGWMVQKLREARSGIIRRLNRKGKTFVDVNHEFTPFGPLLLDAYPSARIIHLVRHPVDVVASFMSKFSPPPMAKKAYMGTRYSLLGQLVYRFGYLDALARHLPSPVASWIRHLDRDTQLHPFVYNGGEWVEDERMSAFEKTAWYWNEINQIVLELVESLADERTLRIRSEELFDADRTCFRSLVDFIDIDDIEWNDYREALEDRVNTRSSRTDFPSPDEWSSSRVRTIRTHCGETMRTLGYELRRS